ncbi:MAG: VapB-type antitoxin [Thermoprotei archaeon]|nr:MAG: VapB-type antitoxin [Thermoprotei archaeon]
MSSVVISVRVPRRIKELLEREGIDVSEEVKKYLELLALRVKAKRFAEKWDRILSERVVPSREGFAEKSVREDRESH